MCSGNSFWLGTVVMTVGVVLVLVMVAGTVVGSHCSTKVEMMVHPFPFSVNFVFPVNSPGVYFLS